MDIDFGITALFEFVVGLEGNQDFITYSVTLQCHFCRIQFRNLAFDVVNHIVPVLKYSQSNHFGDLNYSAAGAKLKQIIPR